MCKQGTYGQVRIGNAVLTTIDACIAPIVQALNDAGLETVACCCGHGRVAGNIALRDGREIMIARNHFEARLMEGRRRK